MVHGVSTRIILSILVSIHAMQLVAFLLQTQTGASIIRMPFAVPTTFSILRDARVHHTYWPGRDACGPSFETDDDDVFCSSATATQALIENTRL